MSKIENCLASKEVYLLVQSYVALRLAYFLIFKKYNLTIITSKPSVVQFCNALKIPVIAPNYYEKINFINKIFIKLKINIIIRNLYWKKKLKLIAEKNKNCIFIITILGMDYEILPALIGMKDNLVYFDDSFYAKRYHQKNQGLLRVIKLKLFNSILGTKFNYFNDEIMSGFTWMNLNDLPKEIIKLPCSEMRGYAGKINLTITNKKYPIVFLGDYNLFEMSQKCNIGKLLNILQEINKFYPGKLFYKPHPGATDKDGLTIFNENVIPDYFPAEILSNNVDCFLTIGSAAVVSLDHERVKVIGLGNLVDLIPELLNMSSIQGLNNVKDKSALFKLISDSIELENK